MEFEGEIYWTVIKDDEVLRREVFQGRGRYHVDALRNLAEQALQELLQWKESCNQESARLQARISQLEVMLEDAQGSNNWARERMVDLENSLISAADSSFEQDRNLKVAEHQIRLFDSEMRRYSKLYSEES